MIAGPFHNPLEYRSTPLATLLPVELETALRRQSMPRSRKAFSRSLPWKAKREVRSSDSRMTNRTASKCGTTSRASSGWWRLPIPSRAPSCLRLTPPGPGVRGNSPSLSMHATGAGKVIFHATDDTWRWRFRVGDLYYGRYWVQAIRYLCRSRPGQRSGGRADARQERLFAGESVYLRVRFIDERLTPWPTTGSRSSSSGRETLSDGSN